MLKRTFHLISLFALISVIAFSQVKLADNLTFKLNGTFNTWFQYQQNFWFGKGTYNDAYIVQMLRFRPEISYKNDVKIITRFDMAQGWWGVDNEPPLRKIYNVKSASLLFSNKDVHYLFHVDQAYLWFRIPELKTAFSVGRMQWLVGNRILIDNNYDGVQMDISIGNDVLKLGWAKVNEGVDALSDADSVASDYNNSWDARDADLYLVNYSKALKFGNTKLDLYAFYYIDRSTKDGNAYIPNLLDYKKVRFSPQITNLFGIGIAGSSKFGKLTLDYEVNYLKGKDKINNSGYGPTLDIDINNGDIDGGNIYLKCVYSASDKVKPGFIIGVGSGDPDGPWQGKGNVTKLRTAGFFYITEVWEDSIMPDEEGITPQGLGAPNVRGYRELENTIIGQANLNFNPVPDLSLFVSYSYIRANKPIYAWSSSGPNPNLSAKDLGWEVDFKADYKVHDGKVILTLRGGYFKPGRAAGYLINGTDEYKKAAWELKGEVWFNF